MTASAIKYPTMKWAKTVCKIGQKSDTCRYLSMVAEGWSCEKHSHLGITIDRRVEEKTMGARGDNCEGLSSRVQDIPMTELNVHDVDEVKNV